MKEKESPKKHGIEKVAVGTSTLHRIKPSDIHVEPNWNARTNTPDLSKHIRTLADSIKKHGVLEPLTVTMKGGKPTLTNGHCRLEAINLAVSEGADIPIVKIQLECRTTDEVDHVNMMLLRNSGKALELSERAKVLGKMRKLGLDEDQIVGKTGFRHDHVRGLLKFMDEASPEIHKMIAKGIVSPSLAVHTVIREGHKATDLLKKAVAKAEAAGKTHVKKAQIPGAVARDHVKPIEKIAAKLAETDPVKAEKIKVLTDQLRELLA